METKINIAEILRNKPQGIKLYSPIFGECTFCCIREDTNDICVKKHNGVKCFFDSKGLYYNTGEVMLFPSKEMRDWEKFSWKRGDVLVSNDGKIEVIFEKFNSDTYQSFTGKHQLDSLDENLYYQDGGVYPTAIFNIETEDAAQTYIKTIEEKLDGKLNLESLEIEKNQPEFKDGDVLFVKCYYNAFIEIFNYSKNNGDLYDHASLDVTNQILDISGKYIICKDEITELRLATEEEKQQLFSALEKEGKAWDSDKKAIVDLKPKVELKPFDKVLVRDSESQAWQVSLFSYKDSDSYYCCNGCSWNQCIPYIGNESLLGTTKDVEG